MIDKYMIKIKGDPKKISENDFIKISIIDEWVNINTKGDELASILFHHFYIHTMCESTLELGLQQLFFVIKEIIFNWIYMRT